MEQTLVMLAQADRGIRDLTAHVLRRWGFYEVLQASDGDEALQLICPEVEIAVVDWELPRANALSLCRLMKSRPRHDLKYVIMVFSPRQHEDVLRALEAGMDDYAVKPVHPDDLLERVVEGERVVQITKLSATVGGKRAMSDDLDPVTGLADRACFDRLLREELARAGTRGEPLALTVIELDGLQWANERYGPAVGAQFLQRAGRLVKDQIRQSVDTAGRFGADSFAVLSPNTNRAGAKGLGERIRRGILELRVPTEETQAAVTASLGIAVFVPREGSGETAEADLLGAVERRLCQAKVAGGNRVAA